MKKFKTLLIVGLIFTMILTGCNAKGNDNHDSSTNTENKESEENKKPEGPEEPDDNEVYEKFLKGETTAIAGDNIEGLTKDKEYTINDMAETFASAEGEYYMPNILNKIEYGAVDCGGDGIVEIAVKFVYTNEDENDFAQVMVVLKNYNGTIRALYRTDEYYRSYSTVLVNGIIISGGSNSAFESTVQYRAIDKDGNVKFIASVDVALGLSACIIPAGYLPEPIDSTEFPTVPDLCTEEDGGYTMEVIKTAEYDWSKYNAAEYYEFSKKHMYFIFCDGNDVYQEADPEYATYYENKLVNVVAPDKAENFLEEIFAKYGFTNESTQFPEVTWKELDMAK